MNTYPQTVRKDIVVQKAGDETLLYNLKTNKALCLNETSALIWEVCDGKTSISEIAEQIGKRLKKPVTEELVWLAFDQLAKENLLDHADGLQNNFEDLSRREVIRKVGFASVVALPIITSVVAPRASYAQSCGGILSPAPLVPGAPATPISQPNNTDCITHCTATQPNPACCNGISGYNGTFYNPMTTVCSCANYTCQ